MANFVTDIPANEFKCALCGGVFEKGWTDEEAKSEMEADFGKVPLDECDVICDDCYEKVKPQKNPDKFLEWKILYGNDSPPNNPTPGL